MDKIFIDQLQLQTIIGLHDWEKEKKQTILLDIEIACSIEQAAQTDNISDSIDYFSVCERLKKLAENHHYQLVESFAEEVSHIILQEFSAPWVKVKLSKPEAVNEARGVGVILERKRVERKRDE
ncbi:MAG: dihydroneopterin aldolase [gamma proteobacterium symbiont of Taylorina sp.]|nr:dihydroneopterin aldolase [gamma proteobacterium symbiont of Taylorina sp.]